MRLSNRHRCQLAGHADRDAAGSLAIPRSFGAARRRRCQFGFPARELSLWRGAGGQWRAVCPPFPQSRSHRRDRVVQARLGAWGCLSRCTVCRSTGQLARTLGDPVLTHGGKLNLGASLRYSLLRGHHLGDLWERGKRPLTVEDCRAIQECEDGGCRCNRSAGSPTRGPDQAPSRQACDVGSPRRESSTRWRPAAHR
jgi:hypothetical protein